MDEETKDSQPPPPDRFREIVCIILGGFTGCLIAIPAAAMIPRPGMVVPLGTALGFLVGYRRRKSPAFLYFALFSISILSTLILFGGGAGD